MAANTTKQQAYYILYRRIEEGFEKLEALFGSDVVRWRSEGRVLGKSVFLINRHTNYVEIESCFDRAQEWLYSASNAEHFAGGRWAELPSIRPAEQVNLSEHTSWSNRRYLLLDCVRREYGLNKSMPLESVLELLEEGNAATELVSALKSKSNLEVLVRKKSVALRAKIRVGDIYEDCFLKNGLICHRHSEVIVFNPPAKRERKSREARRRAVPGLTDTYYIAGSL